MGKGESCCSLMKNFLCPAERAIDILLRIFTRINGTSRRNDAVRNEKTRPELTNLTVQYYAVSAENLCFSQSENKSKEKSYYLTMAYFFCSNQIVNS